MKTLINKKTNFISKFVSWCSSKPKKRLKIITIASKCYGKQKNILLFKDHKNPIWQCFDKKILGFTYKEGYEYELIISDNDTPQTVSMVRILTKTKKVSENIP